MIIKCKICDGSYDSEQYPFFHRHNPDRLCRECFKRSMVRECFMKNLKKEELLVQDSVKNRWELLDL